MKKGIIKTIVFSMKKQNEWINVKNATPEEYKSVIIYTTKKRITLGIFDGEDWISENDERIEQWNIGKVTHWQPLPKLSLIHI